MAVNIYRSLGNHLGGKEGFNRMKEFNHKVIHHKNGFPADIDANKPITVQVTKEPLQSVVLYTSSATGRDTRCYLPLSIGREYDPGIKSY